MKTTPESPKDLRQRAEELFRASEAIIPELTSPEETKRLLHELCVHQIQLEMQNEELRDKQQELDAVRARYFDLYDLAPVGYLTFNENGLILEANLSAAIMLGAARTLLLQNPMSNFIPPDDQDDYYLHCKRLVNSGDVHEWEMRMLRADGSTFWAHLQATPTQGGGYLVTFSNISVRKRADEELLESEARYHAIIEDQTELICRYLPDGRLSFVNGAYSRYYGTSQGELIDKNFIPNIPEPDMSMIIKCLDGITRDNPVVNYTHRIIKPSGELRWQHWTQRGIYSTDGTLIEYQAVGSDISESKQAEEALKSSSSLLRAALESTADGLLIVDSERRITAYNQKFAEMWKIPADVLAIHDDDVLLNHAMNQLADPEQFLAKVRETYAIPEEVSFDQLEFVDGRVFERYSQPQIIGDNVVGRVWSFSDITERKLAEEKLHHHHNLLALQKEELETTLARVKRLEGIIPICSYCKKIRDDQKSWHQLERYISDHSEALFSHGACPDCFAEQMRNIKKMK